MRLKNTNKHARVALVGYEDQDNLGVRYIAAVLKEAGHAVSVIVYSKDHEAVVEKVIRERPDVVGLSLIFQSLLPEFGSLVALLRDKGVAAHITIGGHFSSFEPETALKAIPSLDSVVLHEGEEIMLELAQAVADGASWKDAHGIVFFDNGSVKRTPDRLAHRDLDLLPWPDRADKIYTGRLPKATMLGSRGCPWRCSFCSITNFYAANGTKGRRLRSPDNVADEMAYLRWKKGVRVILWQDDEFLGGGRPGVEWAHALAKECVKRGLNHELKWKISCRSDAVTYDHIVPLIEAGLTHVYLGVESGDRQSLKHLNKQLTPEDHFKAKEVITGLGLTFDYGFMLLEPWSTVDTVRNNISFLRDFASDGSSVAGFCRMLPYAGTAAEKRLADEGRLQLFNDCIPDYRFLDERLDVFYDWALNAFYGWNYGEDGIVSLMRAVLFDVSVELPDRPSDTRLRREARQLAAVSNKVMVNLLELALEYIEERVVVDLKKDETLAGLTSHAQKEEDLTRRHATRIFREIHSR
ncbi:MAG: hypothetical protein A3J24_08410 [Deltaproteobacteria bacterium RIFCSPLOWO2_02_FULL_53_8]|nr:MAG: hypothetical protein A3J24_08410 [Deltaproteobacteria bacterium RIFCSPLOWO2_02_FULL_53_8]